MSDDDFTPSAPYVSQRRAARELGISWETFDKRRKAGLPLYQPDHTDPDSGRRTWNLLTLLEAHREAGRKKARAS